MDEIQFKVISEKSSTTRFDRDTGDWITTHDDGQVEVDSSGRHEYESGKKFWRKFEEKHPESYDILFESITGVKSISEIKKRNDESNSSR